MMLLGHIHIGFALLLIEGKARPKKGLSAYHQADSTYIITGLQETRERERMWVWSLATLVTTHT